MERIAWKNPWVGGAIAVLLATTLAGCGGDDAGTSAAVDPHEGHNHAPGEHPGEENSASVAAANGNTATTGAAIGSEQNAGPFKVTLTMNPAEAKVGDATFTAKVTRNGQPVEDAEVEINLSMPTMNMPGPEEDLKHTGGGVYTGKANLGMGGYWQAEIEVDGKDADGEAVYGFTAMQE